AGLRGDLCDADVVARFSRRATARGHRGISEARPPLWRAGAGRACSAACAPAGARRGETLISTCAAPRLAPKTSTIGLIDGFQSKRRGPQGLKPAFLLAGSGTASTGSPPHNHFYNKPPSHPQPP